MKRYVDDEKNGREVKDRWIQRTNRPLEHPNRPDEWIWNQCYFCTYYVELGHAIGEDFGVCACAESKKDGQVVFEHDGCDLFHEATE